MAAKSQGRAATLARRLLPWLAAIGSGILLRGGYAPFEDAQVPWLALVPLMIAVRFSAPKRAFLLGLVSGMVFWFTSLAWLWRLVDNGGPWPLVALGHLSLSLYCAAYTGAFAALTVSLSRPGVRENAWRDLLHAVAASAIWVGLELVRSRFLTGFAWNHLGVSQVSNRAVIQLASLGGVYAVSALMMLLNATVATVAVRIWRGARGEPCPRRHWDLMVVLATMVGAFLWGNRQIQTYSQLSAKGPFLMVAAVQPNAPSIFERNNDDGIEVLQRLVDRTEMVAFSVPDLVVWPETALLGAVPRDVDAMEFAFDVANRSDAPLLAGATEVAGEPDADGRPTVIANASWLFEPDGTVSGRYRKQHLVPFGEFIPLDRWFPFLEKLSPIGYSCTAGTNSVLMRVRMRGGRAGRSARDRVGTLPQQADESRPEAMISPLICFEDTVAALSRKAVRAGATLLVNQSNDAWFEGSSEGRQHHAQAVFRAVENRVPLVRCANAGVSAAIDPTGASSDPADFFAVPVTPRGTDWPVAPYTRWGDWLLGWPCVAFVVFRMVMDRRRSRIPHNCLESNTVPVSEVKR